MEAVMADSITGRDFVALHGLLDVDHVDDSGPRLRWQLMASLQELFHCDYGTFDRTWTAAQQFVFEQTLGDVQEYVDYSAADAPDASDAEFWKLYWLSDFCNYTDRTGDITRVMKPNDFYSDREWRTSPMNREFGIPGQSWEMAVYFPDEPGHRMRLMLWRGSTRDFSERDRLLLTLLRPHLIAAYRHAERRRRAPAALTPRGATAVRCTGVHQHPGGPTDGIVRGHRPDASEPHLRATWCYLQNCGRDKDEQHRPGIRVIQHLLVRRLTNFHLKGSSASRRQPPQRPRSRRRSRAAISWAGAERSRRIRARDNRGGPLVRRPAE